MQYFCYLIIFNCSQVYWPKKVISNIYATQMSSAGAFLLKYIVYWCTYHISPLRCLLNFKSQYKRNHVPFSPILFFIQCFSSVFMDHILFTRYYSRNCAIPANKANKNPCLLGIYILEINTLPKASEYQSQCCYSITLTPHQKTSSF